MEAPADTDHLKEEIRRRAAAEGFDVVRFAAADAPPAAAEHLAAYLRDGRHGDMAWMADTAQRRAAPRALWAEAATVIVLGTSYAPGDDPLRLLDRPDRGAVSVYARNRDYHDTVKKRLKRVARWLHESRDCDVKVFVDTAPVMEKPLAQAAGAGWQGKHTNLVSRRYGSWLFLAEIFTSLPLPADAPHPDLCGTCARCKDACPTAAITADHRIDARRCISYLTIEHKGAIPAALRPLIGNRVYGCDDCLAVCPWNKFAPPTREPDFLPRAELLAPRLADLAELDDAAFREVFTASPVKRVGRDRFLRNVLIAIGNSGDTALAEVARRRLEDESALVRGMAVWALGRLLDSEDFRRLKAARAAAESDPHVREEWAAADARQDTKDTKRPPAS